MWRELARAAKLHLVLTIVWVLLIVPTILLWSQSILWIGFMSVYAIIATHWDAYQSARAEQQLLDNEEPSTPD